jgi:hypothetical protein
VTSSTGERANVSVAGGGSATACVDGRCYTGRRSVIIRDGQVTVDGQPLNETRVTGATKVTVTVTGNAQSVTTTSGDVQVQGSADTVKTVSGDVHITGDVQGGVSTVSGDVTAKTVNGAVSTISGRVR